MLQTHDTVDIIRTKRDGHALTPSQIDWVISHYTSGEVAPEQMSALAMAIFLNGMDRAEIAHWTQAMIQTGTRLDYSGLGKATADKHSTGGVGDKITLMLTPLVASFGVAVPQLSGRGLGHTGGTLDKLESIPGWRADLGAKEAYGILASEVGAVICAAGADLAPADKLLYALRDVTATVDCVPLIASSIMSKKIAEGTANLVLDVKVGRGAFMKEESQAKLLARTMVDLGSDAGVATRALLTRMDVPLGCCVGNAIEVEEALETLGGGGPADLRELTVALAREMLEMAGLPEADPATALDNGQAMDSYRAMIRAQGGDPAAPLPQARESAQLKASQSGFVADIDAMEVGVAAWRAGAGRDRPGADISLGAGVRIHRQVGQEIMAGDVLFTVYADKSARLERAMDTLASAATITVEAPLPQALVLDRVLA